jgi:hypothetical protein
MALYRGNPENDSGNHLDGRIRRARPIPRIYADGLLRFRELRLLAAFINFSNRLDRSISALP